MRFRFAELLQFADKAVQILRGRERHFNEHGIVAGHAVALKNVGNCGDKRVKLRFLRRLHIQMNVGENVMSQLERVKVERIGADNALFFQALDADTAGEDSRTSPARVFIGVREFFCNRRSSFRSISSIGR